MVKTISTFSSDNNFRGQEKLLRRIKGSKLYSAVKAFFRSLSKKELIVFLIIVAALVGGIAYWGISVFINSEVVPKEGGSIVIGETEKPEAINPILLSDNETDADISTLIFSSLFRYNGKNELENDLVEDYKVSGDGKTYKLTLKDNVFWHDGTKLTADDVVYTFGLIQNPEINSPLKQSFQGVAARTIDERTVQFKISKPFTPFKSNLTFGILPKHLWENITTDNFELTLFNLQPVGSGPFQFKELKKNNAGDVKSFTVERYEGYYKTNAYLNEISFEIYNSEEKMVDDFTTKKIESPSSIPDDRIEEIEKQKSLELRFLKTPRYFAIFFNATNNELLNDRETRAILATSVKRDEIIDQALNGKGHEVYGPILEGFIGYTPNIKKREFDQDAINKALKKEGWKKNKNGILEKDGKALSFELSVPDSEEEMQAAEIIKSQWEKQGVNVKLVPIMMSDIQDIIRDRDYEALLFGQILNHDPDPYSFWHSSQREYPGLNLSSIYDEKWDSILDSARQAKKEEEREKKYIEFQKLFIEEVPAIFLYSPEYPFGFAKKIKGVDAEFITVPSDRLNDARLWHLNTKRQTK